MELTFYKCNHCGNLLIPVIDAGVIPFCCAEQMEALAAGSTDAATEKHVPVIERDSDERHINISVGSVDHPMTEEHLIQVIVLLYGERIYTFKLAAGDEPKARCTIKDTTVPLTAYAYCNLHGLWKADI